MDLDDLPVGRVLTRREALAVLGSTGTLLPSWRRRSQSGLTPERPLTPTIRVWSGPQDAGPYYVDEKLERSDIRSDPTDGCVKRGRAPGDDAQRLQHRKRRLRPLEGAMVDVWHCDAEGVYSDAVDRRYFDTTGKKFLRGYQATDRTAGHVYHDLPRLVPRADAPHPLQDPLTASADRPTSSSPRCTSTRV